MQSTISEADLVVSGTPLGGGAQGTVFKGTWKGMEVAVKRCNEPNPKDVAVLTSLRRHSNIIRMYGVLFQQKACLIVTELVKDGSLFDFIHKDKKIPSPEQRMYWMKDIALGMEFLHDHHIVHRDLKSANVLLGDRMTAKLCDFGTARELDQTQTQTNVKGTFRWMAPEIASQQEACINRKCDVYSYAMTLFEIVTLQLPFKDDKDLMAMFKALQGERPTLPESDSKCEPFLRRLITACWDKDPKIRPEFIEINNTLDSKRYPF